MPLEFIWNNPVQLKHSFAIQCDYLIVAAEVDRYECQPHDACRVHREADELCFVEVLG